MQSQLNTSLEYCLDTDRDCNIGLETFHIILNSMGATLNILHMVIMANMPELKNLPRLYIMYQNLAFVDIFNSVIAIIRSLCQLNRYMIGKPIISAILIAAFYDWPFVAKYQLVLLAAYDRYVAICTPFDIHTNMITKNINIVISLTWITVLIILANIGIFLGGDICLHRTGGPTLSVVSEMTSVLGLITVSVPLLLMIILTIRLAVEIRNMRQRVRPGGVSGDPADGELIRATRYVIIVTLSLILCLLPVCLTLLLKSIGSKYPSLYSHDYVFIAYDVFAVHGIFNTLIYGWMTSSYRNKARSLFCCSSNST